MSEENNNNLMETLLDEKNAFEMPKVNDLVKGTIISMGKEVYLDINGVISGLVRGKELKDESGELSKLKKGDEVTATVLELENEKGILELSFRSAGHQKAWHTLQELKETGKIVEIKVIEANKGGLMVSLNNVNGFMPVSQLSKDNYPRVDGGNKGKILEKLRSLVNKKLKAKLIDLNEADDKVIFSEKEVYAENKKQELDKYKIGDVVDATVNGIVDFGVFVEFGPENSGLEGLVQISELAWQRIEHPRDIFKVGDKLKAQIIGIENDRVTLSAKKMLEDPWKKAVEKYEVGQTVKGKVLKYDKFGAFVELDKDISGLVHISELSEDKINKTEDIVKVGKEYEFIILSIEPEDHRMGLSLKGVKV